MELIIDSEARTLRLRTGSEERSLDLYSQEAFRLLSRWWVKVGWAQKFSYDFSWFGRPIIQLPEDMIRLQELVFAVRPDVIIETGVAHGGSAVFFASLMEVLGHGRVVSVDVEIRPYNRAAIEAHALKKRITLIEGDSIAATTLASVRSHIRSEDRVLVVLDSCHTRAHVTAELGLYAPLVTPGSYIVVMDGIMSDLHDVPGGRPEWRDDNPTAAAEEFLQKHSEFERDASYERCGFTYSPGGFLRRR